MAYNKFTSIIKNNASLKYETQKRQELLDYNHQDLSAELFNKIKNITSSFADNMLVMDKGSSTFFAPIDQEFERNEIKPHNSVEKLYLEMNNSLFKEVIAGPNQTTEEFQNVVIKNLNQINYSQTNSYSNFTYDSALAAWNNAQQHNAVVYDLETYGGTNKDGAWAPRGITEFSFQTVDLVDYAKHQDKDKLITNKETAVMGWNKEERDDWVNRIETALKNGNGKISDEELRVTAKRLQLYGHAKGETKDGITRVTKFAGDEAYIGGYDIDVIKKGADFLHDAYKQADTNRIDGLLPYHKKFFENIANIQNGNQTLVDFNGINFDYKIINSQLNNIYHNTYEGNTTAQQAIAKIFGIEGDLTNFSPALHIGADRRLDLSGVFKTASDVAGLESVLGKEYKKVLGNYNITRLNRQEHYGEAILEGIDGVMEKSLRHLAEQDTTVAALMAFMDNQNFGETPTSALGPNAKPRNMSAMESAFNIISEAQRDGDLITTTINQSNFAKKLFLGKGKPVTAGRSMLNFSVDADGIIKTASNYIIDKSTKHGQALDGIEKAGYNTGSNPMKGVTYQIGGMFEIGVDNPLLQKLTKDMPEYASKNLIALKVDTYLPEYLKDDYGDMAKSHYMFFNEVAEAEKYMAEQFDYVGEFNKNNNIEFAKGMKENLRNVFYYSDENGNTAVEKYDIKHLKNNEILDTSITRTLDKKREERARSAFERNLYKTAKKSNNYITSEGIDSKIGMQAKLAEARRISALIASNTPLTAEQQQVLGAATETFGYESFASGEKHLLNSTLDNLTANSEKYYDLRELFNGMIDKVDTKHTSDSRSAGMKFESMFDYIVDAYATKFHSDENGNYLDALASNIKMTKKEAMSYFEVDTRTLMNEKQYANLQNNIHNTASDKYITKINLNAAPGALVNDITRKMYGEVKGTANENEKQFVAMRKLVEHMAKKDTDMFEANPRLKKLMDNIELEKLGLSDMHSAGKHVAEELIAGLKEYKSEKGNNFKGIIRKNFGTKDILDSINLLDGGLEKLSEWAVNNNIIQDAFDNTANIVNYDFEALNGFKKNGTALDHINSIVDNIFMPTVKGLTGDSALAHIKQNNNFNKVQQEHLGVMWNKTREAHINTVTQIHQLVQNTGGMLGMVDGQLVARHGDQVIPFKDLAKTRFAYGTMYHKVGVTNVVSKLQTGVGENNSNILESNLASINSTLRKHKYMIERANQNGNWTPDLIDNFRGKITNEMREESVISAFNIHESKKQFEVDMVPMLGQRIKDLVGTGDKKGEWEDLQTLTGGTIKLIRDEIERIGDNFDPEHLSPQIIEALGKEILPLLEQDKNTSPELRRAIKNMTASAKDKDMSKNLTFFVDEDRYSQNAFDGWSNAQRPTLQAGKIDYSVADLERGIAKYKADTNRNAMAGTIFNSASSNRRVAGVAVGDIDSAITVKKAMAGNVAIRALIENNYKKIISNTVEDNVIKAEAKMLNLLYEATNLQEQEKIMDSRLMDSVFQQSANTQYISGKDIATYYNSELNTKRWNKENLSDIEKKIIDREKQIANMVHDNMIKITKDDNGRVIVGSSEGSIVRRGDVVMNYADRFSSGQVSSKINVGRFQHGVFEKKGNIRLTDEQISDFLTANLSTDNLHPDEVQAKAYKLLEDNFNFKFFISDIEQQSYGKYMDGAVEKDMTYGLYAKLGELNSEVTKEIKSFDYGNTGLNASDVLGKILKVDEIENIFGSNQKLVEDIMKERHSLSVKMFDNIAELNDVSIIANHQVAKHRNYGLITEGVLGNIHEKLMSTQGYTQEQATVTLAKKVKDYKILGDNIDVDVVDGTIILSPNTEIVNKYKMHGEDILDNVKKMDLTQLQKALETDEVLSKLGLNHKQISYHKAGSDELVSLENVYGDIAKFKSQNNKELVISKTYASLQQAVDPETMTVYDHQTVKALGMRRQAEKYAIDATMALNKKVEAEINAGNEITPELIERLKSETKDYKSNMTEALSLRVESDFMLGDMENISKPKTIGRQEMRMYNNKVFNYSTEAVVNNYINNSTDKETAMQFIRDSYGEILREEDGSFRLSDEYNGKGVYENITRDIMKQKVFKEGDIAVNEEVLTYGGKGYLRNTYNKALSVVRNEFKDEPEMPISLRYLEELYEGESAHIAQQYNTSKGSMDIEDAKSKGFRVVGLGDQSHMGIDAKLNTVGETGTYGVDNIFKNNTLIYLGEEITGLSPDNPNAYLAIPKAGKVLENTSVRKMFQSQLETLTQQMHEYQTTDFVHGSDEQVRRLQKMKDSVDNIRESIRINTYEKEGALHELGKFEMDESFRLKFSFANNAHLVDDVGDDKLMAEIMDKGDAALKKATINGKSIFDLEKEGAFLDYAFIDSGVFEDLGYFEDDKLKKLGAFNKDTGVLSYKNHEGISRSLDLSNLDDKSLAVEDMKEVLRTTGITANTGRYPMILDDSEKSTRIFLGDNITAKNRARVSAATALAMNADNDGDSASFGVFQSAKGNTFFDYEMAKINAKNNLGEDATAADIRASVVNALGGEREYDTFKSLEAEMTTASIGINKYYMNNSLDDIRSELDKSIKNGTINETMDAFKFKNLYGGMMYANAGSVQNQRALDKNASLIDGFIGKIASLDDSILDEKVQGPKIGSIRRTDIGEHADFAGGKDMAEYFETVLNRAGQLNNEQLKNLDLSYSDIEEFRQHSVARSRWFDGLKEAQSKSRKGSIGPVNVGMQGIRAAGEVLYDNMSDEGHVKKKNIANWVAYELEEEVIGAKHGSVVNNITKAKDLNTLVNGVVHGTNDTYSPEENIAELKTWLNGGITRQGKQIDANLGNDAIEKIWNRMESSGKVNMSDLGTYTIGQEAAAKREFVVNNTVQVLKDISNRKDAREAMKSNKVGGGGANHTNVMGSERMNTLDDLNQNILDLDGYENASIRRANAGLVDDIPISYGATGASSARIERNAKAANMMTNTLSGKGLAKGVMGIAAASLAVGYAGSPIVHQNATQMASGENNGSMTVPMMMDQGAEVVRSSNRGYVINVKANTSQDMRATQKAMRQAAASASGGGVNVSMTVKNKDTLITDKDIEQHIAGL